MESPNERLAKLEQEIRELQSANKQLKETNITNKREINQLRIANEDLKAANREFLKLNLEVLEPPTKMRKIDLPDLPAFLRQEFRLAPSANTMVELARDILGDLLDKREILLET